MKLLNPDKRRNMVWSNECGLVFRNDGDDCIGEMGLCYPDDVDYVTGEVTDREVQVQIREHGGDKLMKQLKGKSVRITIEVIDGGYI